ncbi:hypothetical protein HNY73_010193 [Argiope bruennichi]|uniref:Uncharacterized protein n=1 Tax=Argiope bruennichi TaxID=94029 RepID=A0A8T0F2L7_ARGBR|nr:hypothetical protein HNY73_010193 [Argiope bruennichi]
MLVSCACRQSRLTSYVFSGEVSTMRVYALARSKWKLVAEKICSSVASCAFIRVSEDRPINVVREGQWCGQ